ncbi:hypothetical protein OIU76_009427 [Salix suchowensis]|nr:hypothetical protein OIU76_009427 [Salix suchowensis]
MIFAWFAKQEVGLQAGKGRVLREGSRVAILGYGTVDQGCNKAAKLLEEKGIIPTVADARLYGKIKWRPMMLQDRYIDHGSQTDQIDGPPRVD